MIMWKCDRCGLAQTGDQIVGHEFDYSKQFESLRIAVDGMRDLCKPCMKIANDAAINSLHDQARIKEAAVADALRRRS